MVFRSKVNQSLIIITRTPRGCEQHFSSVCVCMQGRRKIDIGWSRDKVKPSGGTRRRNYLNTKQKHEKKKKKTNDDKKIKAK